MPNSALFLTDIWYLALPGNALKSGQMTAKSILGQSLLFGRAKTGEPFALRNICPHRGIPLSYGRFDGCEVECCYHGWRFNTGGVCTDIPSLLPEQKFNISRVKVFKFPCHEVQGNLWVYIPPPGKPIPKTLPPIPCVPDVGNIAPQLQFNKHFPCDIDHAVVGLMDPAHGPFVHRSWWWRSQKSMHPKAKKFAPTPLGFKMVRHPPSKNSKAYKLLGGEISTEISFQLPGVRIEHIQAGRHTVCALTTLTPLEESVTEIHQFFYWTLPGWTAIFKPLARSFARAFLNQDYEVIVKQQEGLKENPQLMLINDADTQAKWYQQLKKEFILAQTENRQFQHPLTETVLRWRS
ncbi:MAG TPA: Rieske 2Fe-2S domain-containing protein [Gammaproteobacteria bacterium]|nr:Rieske 2Fe-2S domain-containing protein [Gammaproteobacteria bacterium]